MPQIQSLDDILYIEPGQAVFQFLKREDGSGEINMNVNGSGTPIIFCFDVPNGFDCMVAELSLILIEIDAVGQEPENFLNAPALTNGIDFYIEGPEGANGRSKILEPWGGETIKANKDFRRYQSVPQAPTNPEVRDEGFALTIPMTGRLPIRTPSGSRVCIEIGDDLTGVSEILAFFTGVLVGAP